MNSSFFLLFQKHIECNCLATMEPTDLSIKKSSKTYSSRGNKKAVSRGKEALQNVGKLDLSRQCQALGPYSSLSQYPYQHNTNTSVPRDVTNLQVDIYQTKQCSSIVW